MNILKSCEVKQLLLAPYRCDKTILCCITRFPRLYNTCSKLVLCVASTCLLFSPRPYMLCIALKENSPLTGILWILPRVDTFCASPNSVATRVRSLLVRNGPPIQPPIFSLQFPIILPGDICLEANKTGIRLLRLWTCCITLHLLTIGTLTLVMTILGRRVP